MNKYNFSHNNKPRSSRAAASSSPRCSLSCREEEEVTRREHDGKEEGQGEKLTGDNVWILLCGEQGDTRLILSSLCPFCGIAVCRPHLLPSLRPPGCDVLVAADSWARLFCSSSVARGASALLVRMLSADGDRSWLSPARFNYQQQTRRKQSDRTRCTDGSHVLWIALQQKKIRDEDEMKIE